MFKHSQCQLTVDVVCYDNTYPWKNFCIYRDRTSILCYICQCCDDCGRDIVIILQWFLWVVLKVLMILCIFLLSIYPDFTFEGVFNSLWISAEARDWFNEHSLRMNKLIIYIEILVHNLFKIASNLITFLDLHGLYWMIWTIFL